MKRATLSTSIYVLLVFLSGAVVGGFGYRLSTSPVVAAPGNTPVKPEEYRRRYLQDLKTRLSLDAAQMDQLTLVLDTTKSRFKEVKARCEREVKEKAKPELAAIHEDQVRSINAILSAPQQAEYERFRAERKKMREQQQKNPGGAAAKPGLPPGDDD